MAIVFVAEELQYIFVQIGYSVYTGQIIFWLVIYNSVYVIVAAPASLHFSLSKDFSQCCTPQENQPGFVFKLKRLQLIISVLCDIQ